MPVTTEEAAYAAGFFDGEGCIGISMQIGATSRGKRYPDVRRFYLFVSLSQNDPAPINWLMEKFGGSARFVRGKKSYKEGYYERWNWAITTKQALSFLRTIRPFLIVKAEQADLAFSFYETFHLPPTGKNRLPDEINERRADFYRRMKECKNAFRVA